MSVVGDALPDRSRQFHRVGQSVDLRLVEVRDRLHVGRAVAVLDEEALVVLEAIRRPRDRVVEPVRVVVLEHLAGALLEVRRGDQGSVGIRGQPRRSLLAVRALRDEREEPESRTRRIGGRTIFNFHSLV